MTAFGFDVSSVEGDTRLAEPYGSSELIISNAHNIQSDIFLYVASSAFKNPPARAGAPHDDTSTPYLPTHFVRIKNFQLVGDNYNMEYWDYGGWKPHSIDKIAFCKALFGIITIKKK